MREKTMDELVQDAKDRASIDIWNRENNAEGCDVVARMRQLKKVQDWRLEVIEAARKFVNCKGRYHSEQNMTALIELFRQEPEKP
ncbi:hypothetical protein [Serratia sp. JSRIV006]|uniref:hypothetical protein n=1 Tax=Serratia sp. JSRIV006 TaxID=2831896 RepID=UPI001CC095F9|nr:hypothetical protein [Serratia sp. JSRIV006]UAN64277.1 hypothetical protein KGP16_06795 [Serratia sp. JSRIV006]